MNFDIPNSTFDNIHFVKEVGSYFSSILSTNYVVFQTGQFFRLKRMHYIASSLFDFATMQSSLAATDKNTLLVSRSEYPRDKPFLLTMDSYFKKK